MLRKRLRAMTSNQAYKSENGTLPSPKTDKQTKPTSSSFFGSPRFFTGFSVKGFSESESSAVSPTSTLDNKSFGAFINPFWSEKSTATATNTAASSRLSSELSKGVGLAIVDSLNDEETNKELIKPDSRMVLFGSQLKIQIPPPSLPPSILSPNSSPKSPADFGIKTRISSKSPFGSTNSGLEAPNSPHVYLSASEMELSEDYTCVISHGPNPKTTHIFGDCILENCCGIVGFSSSRMENCVSSAADCSRYSTENFLSCCYNCQKKLGDGKDIYMYRGEKAFCSRECRYEEMMFDEGMEKTD